MRTTTISGSSTRPHGRARGGVVLAVGAGEHGHEHPGAWRISRTMHTAGATPVPGEGARRGRLRRHGWGYTLSRTPLVAGEPASIQWRRSRRRWYHTARAVVHAQTLARHGAVDLLGQLRHDGAGPGSVPVRVHIGTHGKADPVAEGHLHDRPRQSRRSTGPCGLRLCRPCAVPRSLSQAARGCSARASPGEQVHRVPRLLELGGEHAHPPGWGRWRRRSAWGAHPDRGRCPTWSPCRRWRRRPAPTGRPGPPAGRRRACPSGSGSSPQLLKELLEGVR